MTIKRSEGRWLEVWGEPALVLRLLALDLELATKGLPTARTISTGGVGDKARFIAFVPSESWPEFGKVLEVDPGAVVRPKAVCEATASISNGGLLKGEIEVATDGNHGSITMPLDRPGIGKFVATARWAVLKDGTLYVAEVHLDGLAPFGERLDLREEDELWVRERLGRVLAEALRPRMYEGRG